MDLKKSLKKNAFIIVAATAVLLWNIGSYYLVAYEGVDLFNPSSDNTPIKDDSFETNIDEIIAPPLGNETNLPNATTYFTLMVFNAPIEITIVFLAEIIMGSILKSDDKRNIDVVRLLILLGSAIALTAVNALVHYLVVWPVMHDIPIHKGYTFNDTSTNPDTIVPQYGGAQTFFSQGVGILLMIIAAIIIVGMHFPVFKFILKQSYLSSGISLVIPAIYYLVIWLTLSNQVSSIQFYDKVGSQFNMSLIISLFFVIGVIIVLIWNRTLQSSDTMKDDSPEGKYEGKS